MIGNDLVTDTRDWPAGLFIDALAILTRCLGIFGRSQHHVTIDTGSRSGGRRRVRFLAVSGDGPGGGAASRDKPTAARPAMAGLVMAVELSASVA